MDIWGLGSVMFEILCLFPLFPGTDELDQIGRIHNILGTPARDLLERFQKCATHMELNFPSKAGTGLAKLAPHIPSDCLDLVEKMVCYNPDDRINAKQALKHAYFKDLKEQEKKIDMLINQETSSNIRQYGNHSFLL